MTRTLGVIVLASALALTGCAAATSSLPPAAEEKPLYGGQLNNWFQADPLDFDPSFEGGGSGLQGMEMAYSTLLSFKHGAELGYSEMVLQPGLAERWEVSPDAKLFTFTLRKGVRFANLPPVNGRELTAADVKWSLEYATRLGEFAGKGMPAGRQAYMYEGLEKVVTPDPYTIQVHFKEAFVPFLSFSGSTKNPVVAREVYEQDGHLKDRPVGSGPFQYDAQASQKGTRWVWQKNPTYWEEGKPYLDEVRWLVVTSDAAAVAAFQTKQLDRLDNMQHNDFSEAFKNNPTAQSSKFLQPYAVNLRLSHVPGKPTTDVRVRRALTMALDRDEINKVLAGGEGEWALAGGYHGLFSEAEIKQMVKHDPAGAQKLLAEAGYAPGALTLELVTDNGRSAAEMTYYQLLQAQLKAVGINMEIVILDVAQQRLRRRAGDYGLDSTTGQGGLVGVDNDSILVAQYHSQSAANDTKLKDPEMDELVMAQRREPNVEKRREMMRAAVKRITDQVFQIGVIYPPKWEMVQSYVRNHNTHFSTEAPYLFSWLHK